MTNNIHHNTKFHYFYQTIMNHTNCECRRYEQIQISQVTGRAGRGDRCRANIETRLYNLNMHPMGKPLPETAWKLSVMTGTDQLPAASLGSCWNWGGNTHRFNRSPKPERWRWCRQIKLSTDPPWLLQSLVSLAKRHLGLSTCPGASRFSMRA